MDGEKMERVNEISFENGIFKQGRKGSIAQSWKNAGCSNISSIEITLTLKANYLTRRETLK